MIVSNNSYWLKSLYAWFVVWSIVISQFVSLTICEFLSFYNYINVCFGAFSIMLRNVFTCHMRHVSLIGVFAWTNLSLFDGTVCVCVLVHVQRHNVSFHASMSPLGETGPLICARESSPCSPLLNFVSVWVTSPGPQGRGCLSQALILGSR